MSAPLASLLYDVQHRLPLKMLKPFFENLYCLVLKFARRQERYRLAVFEYEAELAGRETGGKGNSDVVTGEDGEECHCRMSATRAQY